MGDKRKVWVMRVDLELKAAGWKGPAEPSTEPTRCMRYLTGFYFCFQRLASLASAIQLPSVCTEFLLVLPWITSRSMWAT